MISLYAMRLQLPVPATGAQWAPVLHVDQETNRLWLFYAESRDCIRPAADGVPLRWVPGGDIKATTTGSGYAIHACA